MQSASELRAYSDSFNDMMAEMKNDNSKLNQRLVYLEGALGEVKTRNAEDLERKTTELEEFKQQIEFYKQELAAWDTVHRSKLESEIQTYRSILNTQLRTMKSDSYVTYDVVRPAQTIVQTVVRERSPTPPPPEIIYKTG